MRRIHYDEGVVGFVGHHDDGKQNRNQCCDTGGGSQHREEPEVVWRRIERMCGIRCDAFDRESVSSHGGVG